MDSCENYTRCAEKFPCLPPLGSLPLPACVDKRSSEPGSSAFCTLLDVNLPRFSDGKPGLSQVASGARASQNSIFFHGATLLYKIAASGL
jgi:hypothetical protein